jgi:PAS domain S-box-containing protein
MPSSTPNTGSIGKPANPDPSTTKPGLFNKPGANGSPKVNGRRPDASGAEIALKPGQVNILMVDDTPENLIALEAVLSDLGQNLVKARSGEEALRLMLRYEFAVILLDVNMPGLNGFETASLIRQRKSSETIPIIFVSAISNSETHLFKGYSLGAVDYIFTPVVPDVLRTKVNVFVELLKRREEIRVAGEQLRIAEEKEHQRKLNEAAERLELQTSRNRFFTLSIEMLAIAGFDLKFRQLNPTWHKLLGFTEDELSARTVLEFLHPDDVKRTEEKLARAMSRDNATSFDARCSCKDGTFRWLSWTASSLASDKLLYIFARDVTEQREAQQRIYELNTALEKRAVELQNANTELESEIHTRQKTEEALQASNAALEAFSYSVSHDLRAPLRAMQGFAKLLNEDYGSVLDDFGREAAKRIVMASERMDVLIKDLLAYSRLEHSTLELTKVSLRSLIEEAVTQVLPNPEERGQKLTVSGELPVVMAHPLTLRQVLANLVSNGLKFVPQGTEPRVTIRSEPLGDSIRIWVEDNGIGIAPDDQQRIFAVFERLHSADDYPGTGIGLAIVRKGIERMGGTFGLESEAGKGSRFWIQLPTAKV